MRIGELSRESGVPVATIKYYLREGLLQPGRPVAANQAEYDSVHLRRLRLIRALLDVGRVGVASAGQVVAALTGPDLPPHALLGVAHQTVMPARHPDRSTPSWQQARDRAAALVQARGWRVAPQTPALDQLADALAAVAELDVVEIIDSIQAYADSAQHIAEVEVANVVARQDPEARLELVVLGTILGEALLCALRLLAHEHASATRLAGASEGSPAGAQPSSASS